MGADNRENAVIKVRWSKEKDRRKVNQDLRNRKYNGIGRSVHSQRPCQAGGGHSRAIPAGLKATGRDHVEKGIYTRSSFSRNLVAPNGKSTW